MGAIGCIGLIKEMTAGAIGCIGLIKEMTAWV